MKIFVLSSVIIMLLVSCKKELTSTVPGMDMVDTVGANIRFNGIFMNGPYGSVSGNVKIYQANSQYSLALLNMSISNGPDLHVYISKEMQPINFIDLGRLKSTSGNQVYSLSSLPDFAAYKFVLIHCQQYNHLFGSASIMP